MKKKIIATVLSAITIISFGAIAMTSVSAVPRRIANENYRGQGTDNVRAVDIINIENYFILPNY